MAKFFVAFQFQPKDGSVGTGDSVLTTDCNSHDITPSLLKSFKEFLEQANDNAKIVILNIIPLLEEKQDGE